MSFRQKIKIAITQEASVEGNSPPLFLCLPSLEPLLSSFITEPTLSEISIVPSPNQISLSLKISNPQGLKVLCSLLEDSSLKEETEMTFKGDKDFSYVFKDVDFQKENTLRISFTNSVDYTKVIFEQTVTFVS